MPIVVRIAIIEQITSALSTMRSTLFRARSSGWMRRGDHERTAATELVRHRAQAEQDQDERGRLHAWRRSGASFATVGRAS
jgi:hypothetical protein